MPSPTPNTPSKTTGFRPTRWTRVLAARGQSSEAREALSELCAAYYAPVAAFLRREGRGEDVVHDPADSLNVTWLDLKVADPTVVPPELLFDRAWAIRVLDRAFETLLADAADPAACREFETLEGG